MGASLLELCFAPGPIIGYAKAHTWDTNNAVPIILTYGGAT
jgi:hypothetical protein